MMLMTLELDLVKSDLHKAITLSDEYVRSHYGSLEMLEEWTKRSSRLYAVFMSSSECLKNTPFDQCSIDLLKEDLPFVKYNPQLPHSVNLAHLNRGMAAYINSTKSFNRFKIVEKILVEKVFCGSDEKRVFRIRPMRTLVINHIVMECDEGNIFCTNLPCKSPALARCKMLTNILDSFRYELIN